MAQKKKTQQEPKIKMIPLSTFVVGIIAALAIGFYGGSMFSTMYGGGGSADTPLQPMPQQAAAPQGPSNAELAAIAALEQKVAANPQDLASWTTLGHKLFDSNQPLKAIEAYKKSLELDPSNADVWTDLGVMYRRAAQPREAVRAFDQATFINRKHEVARFNKGIVLMHDLNDKAGALKTWEELLAVNPAATAPNGAPLTEMVTSLRAEIAASPAPAPADMPKPGLAPMTN